MNETSILIIIFGLIGYLASFIAGYAIAKYKYRTAGLGENSGVLSSLSDTIKGTEQRIGESSEFTGEIKDRLDDLIESGGDLEDIFYKYGVAAEQAAKLKQGSDRDDSGEHRD